MLARRVTGMTKCSAMILASISLAGCAMPKPAAPATPAAASDGLPTAKVITLAQPAAAATPQPATPVAAADGIDAAPARQQYFQIGFYELRFRQGEISGNAEFWKPFDETFLGIWQHDLLNKNGLRVGRAPLLELQHLRDQLVGADETPQTLIGTESKDFEMSVRKDVAKQTIFYADKRGEFEGKDFERCDNLFAITFRRAPRHEDRIKLSITPIVRDQREKIEVVDRESMRVQMFQPESLYDLGVQTELGINECLVIAPNANALENKTNVGRIFLMEDRPAERVEKILVIVPKVKGSVIETTPGTARR